MAESPNQSQREYNDLLGMTQSMLGKINNAMGELDSQTDKRNKKLSQEISLTRQILDSITDEKDMLAAIRQIRENTNKISKQDFGVNKKLLDQFLAQSSALEGILEKHRQSKEILQKVSDKVDLVKDKFGGVFDNITDGLSQIPLIGDALSSTFAPFAEKTKRMFNVVGEKFKSGFSNAFMKSTAQGNTFAQSVKAGIGGGFGSAMKMAGKFAAMLGPIGIAVLVIAAGLALGFKRFQELDAAAQEFRETTGLLVSQTYQTQQNIQNVSRDMATLGVSASDVAKAAADFTNEFDGLEQPSAEVLSSMVALNKNFGIGTQEAAQLNKTFQTMGGLTEAQSQSLINSTAEMAKMAGVAPSKVIKDMADNAEAAYTYFDGNPEALAKAAVQAAKLGTSITQAASVADGLLDFESSITKELEASAMLGTRINLSQARSLAANNDILGAQQAVLDQVSQLGDLTKLNRYEQEALADATGMPIGDLIRQQQIREKFGRLDSEQLAAATALLDTGKDITQITEKDLKAQNERMKAQQEMQSEMDKLSNVTSAISTSFMDMFAPIAGFLIPILADVVDIVGNVLMPVFRIVGVVLKTAFGMLSAVLSPIFAIGKAIIGAVMKPLESIGDAIAPIGDKFGELKSKIMPYLQPIINIFTSIGNILGTVIGGAVSLLVDLFLFLADTIFGVFESIAGFVNTYLIDPIMSVVNTIGGAVSSIGSFLGFGDETPAAQSGQNDDVSKLNTQQQNTLGGGLEDGGSINDGIVQDGKIITTNPEDTLIASKTPGDLLGGLAAGVSSLFGGGGGGDNTAMVSKLDELILAVKETRDVYMDGRKVTAGVSNTVDKIGSNSYAVV
jgi:molecular chaperone GrpE (heat shock protein)